MILDYVINISLFLYGNIFEILIGFFLGIIFFVVLGTIIFSDDDNRKHDLTRKVYDSLMSTVDTDKLSEVDRELLSNVSPKEFENPLQLLSELVRRKTKNSIVSMGSSEKDFRTPPKELLEPNEREQIPLNLKPEIFFVLKALEGYELPESFTLDPKDIEIISVEADSSIFRPGDKNDVLIVVVSGECGVFTKTAAGHEINIKHIGPGDSYFSPSSIIEVLMNVKPVNKYLNIRSLTSCRIAKYNITSFYKSYLAKPHAWIRTIQVIMTRLQHCTLFTCNLYLGIGGKCINSKRKIADQRVYKDFDKLTVEEQITKGVQNMATALGIPDQEELLRSKVSRFECSKGTIVADQNSFDIDLIFVAFGHINLRRTGKEPDDSDASLSFDVWPGETIPSMQILTNEPSMCAATAIERTIYFKLPKEDFIYLLAKFPQIYLRLAFHAVQFVSPFARVFELAVSWIRIDTGQALFRNGDTSNCMYVVMGGRLRSVESNKIIEEYGRLDVIGIIDMAEQRHRRSTVLAVRFSHLVCVSENLLNFVKLKYPLVATKLLQLISRFWRTPGPDSMSLANSNNIQNLRTIAIVPASEDVPLVAFTCELYNSLSKHVKALRLSSLVVSKYFDPVVITRKADYGLMHWLTVQEISYSLIIYQCDFQKTNWTRRCLRMADAILVVAMGDQPRMYQKLARDLLKCNEKGIRQSKELVLLWPKKTILPSGTAEWIREQYYSGYHHLRSPDRMLKFRPYQHHKEEDIVSFYENKVLHSSDSLSDFSRLARILTGNAIGVVFGGGGARGAAHAGALRAILEKKIPIDMVGGTSIGALFGSLYATTPDIRASDRLKEFFRDRAKYNIIDVLRDLTWPHSAVITGHRFNLLVQRMLDETRIEDTWISYFCISTDITTSTMRIHKSGIMWPVVRSSMSIAGYLPPVCDPDDGHLLLDGAYVNNLPADVMRSFGANVVIAIDVGLSDDSSNLTNYGCYLSGFWVLFKRLWPFGEPIRVLSMSEIQNRLAYVCCVHQMEAVKKAPFCHYIKLPIENFPIFNFNLFDQADKIGYDHTMTALNEVLDGNPVEREKLLGRARNLAVATHHSKNDESSLVNFSRMPMVAPTFLNTSPQTKKDSEEIPGSPLTAVMPTSTTTLQ